MSVRERRNEKKRLSLSACFLVPVTVELRLHRISFTCDLVHATDKLHKRPFYKETRAFAILQSASCIAVTNCN